MTAPAFTALAFAKDEGPRLLEWVAFHQLVGFGAIWVLTNDCRDGTDAMLDRLEELGLARHIRNDVPAGKAPQPHGLTLAQRHPEVTHTDWLMVLDIDEYVDIAVGLRRLPDLVEACPTGTEGIALTWRSMGSSGHAEWSDAPLLTQFTHGAPDEFRRGWGVKTLFRPFPNLRLGIHRPGVQQAKKDPDRMAQQRGLRWVSGGGVPMPPRFLESGWRNTPATVGFSLGQVAHFGVQSQDAFLLRGDRGNVNAKPAKYEPAYFAIFDRNEVAQPRLTSWSEAVAGLVAEWRQDATLNALHEASVAWHRARLRTLLEDANWRARRAAIRAAAGQPYDTLDEILFTQPLPLQGKETVRQWQEAGVPDRVIARRIAQSARALQAERDALEAREVAAMGDTPWGEA